MNLSRRHLIQSTSAAALLASIGQQAWAQVLETTKIVAGFAPGGTAVRRTRCRAASRTSCNRGTPKAQW